MIFFKNFHRSPGYFLNFQIPMLLSIVAVLFLMAGPAVFAQSTSPSGAEENPPAAASSTGNRQTNKQQLQQKIYELRQLRQKQQQVHQETLLDHPELQKQGQAYNDLVQTTMTNKLAAQGVEVSRLKTLQKKLRTEDLNKKDKDKLAEEFRHQAKKYQQVRQSTLNSPKIRKKRNALVQAIETQNPRAAEIGQKVNALQQEIRQRYIQMQQKQPVKQP